MDLENVKELLDKVAEWRDAHGLTDKELAKQLGVSSAHVHNWFKRGNVPSGKHTLAMQKLLKQKGPK